MRMVERDGAASQPVCQAAAQAGGGSLPSRPKIAEKSNAAVSAG